MEVIIEFDKLESLHRRIDELNDKLDNQTYMGKGVKYLYHEMCLYKNQMALLGPFIRKSWEAGRLKIDDDDEVGQSVKQMLGLSG